MTTTEIIVTGMTCQHCVTAVTEEVSAIDGVTDVAIDLASGGVTITSAAPLSANDISAAVAEAGYQVA